MIHSRHPRPAGRAGEGPDPYLPRHGDLSYDVSRYDLDLDYRVGTNRLSGRATLAAVARQDLANFALDLRGLHVSRLTVDGSPAKFVHRHGRVEVTLVAPLPEGTAFQVSVAYAGRPGAIRGPDGRAGWEELADGVIVASQPHGAPSWFPCNDRPSNKAAYRVTVTTGSDYHVVANGVLVSRRRVARGTSWSYEQAEPMATYLATVQIGRYAVTTIETSDVPVQLVHPAQRAREVGAAFARQAEMITTYAKLFGPYPFAGYTVVVTEDPLEIPIESQGMSIFGSNYLGTGWERERLIAHELAHQWFGNSLTTSRWRDIWLHEGFACYSEWLWSEASGRASAAAHARDHWQRLADQPQDLTIGDPGPTAMFDDRVYKRGALTLHALRGSVGDQAFFRLLRAWTARHAHGSVSTGDFRVLASSVGGQSVDDLLRSWLLSEQLPPFPRAARPPDPGAASK
jgi:aminopeptidase N